MKRLLLSFLLIPILILAQSKAKELSERIDYFKSQPIFVTQFTLGEKSFKKLSDKEIEVVKRETEKMNKNIRTAFTTFWELNDTLIFVADTELKTRKKEFKGAIFFELVKLGESTNEKGKIVPITAFRLSRPDKADYFNNVVPRLALDSSLVNMVTEVRQLKLNVTAGDIMSKKGLGQKIILINKEDKKNKLGESYLNLIHSKFKNSFKEVDNKFVLDAIMSKDPKYVYVKNGSTFNADDGSMSPVY
jgi:hypothetical protein